MSCGNDSDLVLCAFESEFKDLSSCVVTCRGIGHFTVVCLVTLPLNASEAGVELALIQTSLLFHSNAN